jgi:hypothetical protein
MANFAELDGNNIVKRVLVTDNALDDQGLDWLEKTFGGTWMQTSYNTSGGVHALGGVAFRKNYAGIGYSYDKSKDAFISPKPYESWVLDEVSFLWVTPIPLPDDAKKNPDAKGKFYEWNESEVNWTEIRGE